MAVPSSRMERLIILSGGEEKLQPKLPPPPSLPASSSDEISKLPTIDHFLAESGGPDKIASTPTSPPMHVGSRSPPTSTSTIHPQTNIVTPSVSEANVDLSWDPRFGEPAPRGISFTPFGAVSRFCYKFVTKEFQQPLATAFFDAGKIFAREWDLYYVWSNHHPSAKPIVFVPEHQLEALLAVINESFPKVRAAITDELREEGLAIDFNSLPTELRPCWLGHSTSRAQYNSWTENIPYPEEVQRSMVPDRSLKIFREKMELAIEIAKNKSRAKRKQTHVQTVVRRQEMTKQLLRAQRYLGLLPKKEDDLISGMSSLSIDPIDPNDPAPFPQDLDVIFIAIDVEAYERSPKPITEVGVATLDTRDLHGKAPGPVGGHWQQHIRARHFRILEYKHLINVEFVQGCPDSFEFGDSEHVGKDSIASVLASCFHAPFSQKPAPNAKVGRGEGEEKRNIVLLGHDVNQDIDYLHQLGFSVLNRGNLLEAMDTAVMFRSYTHDPNARSLGSILYHFDLTGWSLHNAGNDAVYTIWAMLGLCVQEAGERGKPEVEERHEDAMAERTAIAVDQGKERAKGDAEGWAAAEGEDGGGAVSPSAGASDSRRNKAQKPVFGPEKVPEGFLGYYTTGGALLDV